MWGQPSRLSGRAQRNLAVPQFPGPRDFLVNRQTTLDLNYLCDSTANIFLQKCHSCPLLCDIMVVQSNKQTRPLRAAFFIAPRKTCHSERPYREEPAFQPPAHRLPAVTITQDCTENRFTQGTNAQPRQIHPARQTPRRVGRTPFPAPRRRARTNPRQALRRLRPLRLPRSLP